MVAQIVVGLLAAILIFIGVDGFGSTYPPGPIYKKVGDSLEVICNMDITSKLAEGKNSSYLSFWSRNNRFNDSSITILNETSIQLTLHKLQETKETLICKLDNKDGVSYSQLFVGREPETVKDFKCRSYNWQYMKCSFEKKPNPVVPRYTLQFAVDRKPLASSVLRNYFINTNGRLDSLNGTLRALLHSDKTLRKQSPKYKFSVNKCVLNGTRGMYWCKIEFDSPDGYYRQNYEYYYFKLFAESPLGNLTENYVIDHYKSVIPDAPTNFTTSNWTSNSAVMTWNIPYQLSTFPRKLTFRLNYTSSYMNGEWKQLDDITGNKTSYTVPLNNLKYAYDWYDMRVAIKVDTADDIPEMWSAFANHTFQTKARTPDNPPTADMGSFSINDHGHIFVYWRELAISRSNGPNLHYEISLQNNRSLAANKVISTMAKYENLDGKYNGPLEFSIYSVNDVGRSKAACSLRIPSAALRLEPPQNIKKFLHNQVYNLTWLPPREATAVTSYTVFWCNSTDEQSGQCTSSIDFERVDRNTNNFIRSFNGTTLNFAVSANSPSSSSGMVWSKCTALPNSDIGKLEKIWIKELHSTYMVFEWMLSCIDHAILKGFRLTYCPINDPKLQDCRTEPQSIEILGEINGYNLTGLKPYTTYKTYIQMFSQHSIGPNSDNLVNTTMETAPTPPRNLQYTDLTNSTVTLTWDEPEQYNGVLSKYEIHYNFDKRTVEGNRSNHLRYVLDNLDAFTDYQIVVKGCTNGGNACSKSSNSVKLTTAIGTPGEIHQAKTTDATVGGYGIYTWAKPDKPAGPINYYEVKLRLTLGNSQLEETVRINGTRCTMTKKYCNGEIDLFEISVRGVNVIQSAHAKSKRDLAANYIELENSQLAYDTSDGNVLKRHSNAEISSTNTAQNIQSITQSIHDTRKLDKDVKVGGVTDEGAVPPFPKLDLVCEEQVDHDLDVFMGQDRFARHLKGNWSTQFASHCDHGNVGIFNLLIIFLLIMTIGFVYAAFYAMKKIRKMKDIGVELPAGLENIKEETMGKGFECNMNNRPDIKREREIGFLCTEEQEQSLLRSRMESGSSVNTENSSHCECNEAMEDSEYEHPDDPARRDYENTMENSSPTPLLPVKIDSPLPLKKDPVPNGQPGFNMLPGNYVQPSAVMRPPPMTTSSGYVTHDAVMGKPPPSGYTPWVSLENKTQVSEPPIQTQIQPTPPAPLQLQQQQSLTPLEDKVKTPIVASTDINGISGYVTHKQLSDFGQMMQ